MEEQLNGLLTEAAAARRQIEESKLRMESIDGRMKQVQLDITAARADVRLLGTIKPVEVEQPPVAANNPDAAPEVPPSAHALPSVSNPELADALTDLEKIEKVLELMPWVHQHLQDWEGSQIRNLVVNGCPRGSTIGDKVRLCKRVLLAVYVEGAVLPAGTVLSKAAINNIIVQEQRRGVVAAQVP